MSIYILTNAPALAPGPHYFKDTLNGIAVYTKTGKVKKGSEEDIYMAVVSLPEDMKITGENGRHYFTRGTERMLIEPDEGEFVIAVQAGNQREAVAAAWERSKMLAVVSNVECLPPGEKPKEGVRYIVAKSGKSSDPRQQYTETRFSGIRVVKPLSVAWEETVTPL